MIENPLALRLLEGDFGEGDAVRVDAKVRARLRTRRAARAGGRLELDVVEEVGALLLGRSAVDVEDELLAALVPHL